MSVQIFTIGYGQDDFAPFAERLRQHKINLLVDVRSAPYSRYQTDFRSGAIEGLCQDAAFSYRFFGNRIGGKPASENLLTAGRPDHAKMRVWPPFVGALEEVILLAAHQRVALMCGCLRPMRCHRGILLSPELIWRGATISHIIGPRILSHAEAILDETKGQMSLFG